MNYRIELEQEEDGRWIAEVAELSGVMVYGQGRDEALAKVQALALRVLAALHAYNGVNLKKGYPLLEIPTPREVPGDE